MKGISDVASAKDYSRTINLKDAAELLHDTTYLYSTVLKDSKNNLTEIVQKADAFMSDLDIIWDREDLKDSLKSVFAQDNQFVCLLGGKSTGKTLVIRNFEKTRMGTVFVVNLRRHSDILEGLLKVLEERVTRVDFLNTEGTIKTAGELGAIAAEIAGKKKEYERLVKFFEAISRNNNATRSLEALIEELVKKSGDKITLIIDEANIAFTIKPETTRKEIIAVRDALQLFTFLTKETRKV